MSHSITKFSAIKFFNLLEREITDFNCYPLTRDNLVIQQDAYKRLGSANEDAPNEDAYAVFATLECGRKEKDSDLRFSFEFSALGFLFHIEGYGSFYIEYANAFKDEKQAMEQVLLSIKLLSNGQISIILTERNGHYCATETILYKKDDRIPIIMGTEGDYPWWWKTLDETDYDCRVLKNKYLEDQYNIPANFYLLDYTEDGAPISKGRLFTSNELTPLTKRLYRLFMHQFTAKVKDDVNHTMYTSWEFWVLATVTLALLFGGSAMGYLPHFILEYPIIAGPVLFVLSNFVIWKILDKKEHYVTEHPDHPWIKFDTALKKRLQYIRAHGYSVSTCALALLMLATAFFPIYAPKYTNYFSSTFDVAKHYSWAYTIPALFALASILALSKRKLIAALYLLSILIGSGLSLYINLALSFIQIDTPEPYSTIAFISYIVGPIIASVICIFMVLVKKKSKKT
jgi:hypothetical protein